MRTTITLDDDLLAQAGAAIGSSELRTILDQALTALVERESARRLARLGGSDPKASAAPRRRTHADKNESVGKRRSVA